MSAAPHKDPLATPRAERTNTPLVMMESLGPLALSDFSANGFELLVWRTTGPDNYALAKTGEEPPDARAITTPISEFGAHVLAFEILAGELTGARLEEFAKTLAAYVFAKGQDTGGMARQRRHLQQLARDHGFGGDA
jgi:hypothetical protein